MWTPGTRSGTSVEYVRYEGETLALDEALVEADSVTFHADAVALSKDPSPDPKRLLATIDSYTGSFAPEFEYEDWAQDWREQLSAAFLHLVDRARAQLLRAGMRAQRFLSLKEPLHWSLAIRSFTGHSWPSTSGLARALLLWSSTRGTPR